MTSSSSTPAALQQGQRSEVASQLTSSQKVEKTTTTTATTEVMSKPRAPSADTDLVMPVDGDSPFLLLEDEYREHSSAAAFCRFRWGLGIM